MSNGLISCAAGVAALLSMGFASGGGSLPEAARRGGNASPMQLSSAQGLDRAGPGGISEGVVTRRGGPGLAGDVGCVCDGVWSVGDQVIRVADTAGSGGPPVGSTGTVVCGETTFIDLPILICWDGFLAGHDGQGFCACPGEQLPPGSTCGWYVDCSDIQLVPACHADLNRDDQVSGLDLAILLGQWTGEEMYSPCLPDEISDLNGDCRINGIDLALLLGLWGPCSF